MEKDAFLLVLKDEPIDPSGPSAGGEVATRMLAEALAAQGHRTIVAGQLQHGELTQGDVEYWDLGPGYDTRALRKRARALGGYHLVAVTLAQALLEFRDEPCCRSLLLYSHAPNNAPLGLRYSTVTSVCDLMLCVSHAQRDMVIREGGNPEKISVVRNAINTDLFRYAGPEGRNWRRLVFAGVLIYEKGIQVLLNVFGQLKAEFPDLSLDLYGRKGGWKVIDDQQREIEQALPGLRFHGAVSQPVLAQAFREAGICVVPSISFETCSLVSLDAQASGCPVVAFAAGGIPEFIRENQTGIVVWDISQQALYNTLRDLLRNPDTLAAISRNCQHLALRRTWRDTAGEIIAAAEQAAVRRAPLQAPAPERVVELATDPSKLEVHDHPHFSILIPTYNHARFLPEAIDSLRAQSYPHWEAVVIDDGSTDNTAQVLEKLNRLDPQVRTYRKENGGTASALNTGLERARYEWIGWLSADDLFEPEKLALHCRAIELHPSERFFHTAFFELNESTGGKSTRSFNQPPGINLQTIQFYYENPVNGNSMVAHRSLFGEVGTFDEAYRNAQDFDMWLRISRVTPLVFLPQHSCTTRVYPTQVSTANPEAGLYDSARSVLNFCNRYTLAEQLPFADLDNREELGQILQRITQIILAPHAFMYCGTGFDRVPLLERVTEYLRQHADLELQNLVCDVFGQLSEESLTLGYPPKLSAALRGASSREGWTVQYHPLPPFSAMIGFAADLARRGEHSQAQSLTQYLTRTASRTRPEEWDSLSSREQYCHSL